MACQLSKFQDASRARKKGNRRRKRALTGWLWSSLFPNDTETTTDLPSLIDTSEDYSNYSDTDLYYRQQLSARKDEWAEKMEKFYMLFKGHPV